jgi:hypothetical protein
VLAAVSVAVLLSPRDDRVRGNRGQVSDADGSHRVGAIRAASALTLPW